jgi:hypothetical protein
MVACAEPPRCITGNLKPGLIERNDDRTDAVQQQIKFATSVRSFARLAK